MKLEGTIESANDTHAGGNLPIEPTLCKSSFKGRYAPNWDDGENVLTIFQINKIFIWTPARIAQYITYCRIFHKNMFELMSLKTWADAIYKDHDTHLMCLRRPYPV